MVKMNVLVVVYNKRLNECITLESIDGAENVSVYVADNSTKDYGNAALAEACGYHYIPMGGNMGLSKAYNAVIDLLDKNDDLICLFDDDTAVAAEYFSVLRKEAQAWPHTNIFAPVVKDRVGILSPCIQSKLRAVRIRSLSELPHKGISVINSGLAVRLKVFVKYRYDEGLFLDYIDHAFIRDVADQKTSAIRIMNVTLDQNFTGSETGSKAKELVRYKIFQKDIRYFAEKYKISWFEVVMLLLRRRIKMILKFM